MAKTAFPGFPAEALAFFRSLARNNKRDWFEAHRETYLEQVKAPMIALVTALSRDMMEFAPAHVTEPEKAIFRIYRDTRFSKDKTPYKTHIAAIFPRRGLPKHGGAAYYVSVSHKEVEIAGGIYMPPPDVLFAVRQHVAARHEQFRQLCGSTAVKNLFGSLHGEQASRVPKGFSRDHPAADLLRYRYYLLDSVLDPAVATSAALYREVLKRFQAMAPFIDFLNAPLVATAKPRKAFLFSAGFQTGKVKDSPR